MLSDPQMLHELEIILEMAAVTFPGGFFDGQIAKQMGWERFVFKCKKRWKCSKTGVYFVIEFLSITLRAS